MRLSHPFIFSGLPRDVGLLGPTDEKRVPVANARVEQQQEHLSTDLLWDVVKSGRPLDDVYLRHVSVCRDCRQFIAEFSDEAPLFGNLFHKSAT